MHPMIRPLTALAMLTLAACGGGYCDKTAKYAEDCGQAIEEADLEACEESVAPCSRDDEKLLDDSLDCSFDLGLFECGGSEAAPSFNSTGTSTGGTTTGFEDFAAILACYAPLASLSPECSDSLGMGFTTSFSPTSSSTTTTP